MNEEKSKNLQSYGIAWFIAGMLTMNLIHYSFEYFAQSQFSLWHVMDLFGAMIFLAGGIYAVTSKHKELENKL